MKYGMKKLLCLSVICGIFLMNLSACTPVRSKIVYTVYPIGYIVSRLTGDTIPSDSLQENTIIQRATIKEDYLSIIEDAAVLLHIGQLEPYLPLYSTSINAFVPNQIDLSTMNAVYDFGRYTQVVSNGEVSYVESPYYRDDSFNLLDVDIKDLYLWTDPIAMLSMSKDILAWLKANDPDNAELYENNLELLENDLINLDAQYQALATSNVLNEKVIRFVSMTASFGNWQKTYGFEVYPVILSKYGALPNKNQLEVIKQSIRDNNVKYIVYEPNMTEDMIQLFNTLQDELHLTRVELSNLSSLTEEEDAEGKDYLSLMYENLKVLETMVQAKEDMTQTNTHTIAPSPKPTPSVTPSTSPEVEDKEPEETPLEEEEDN